MSDQHHDTGHKPQVIDLEAEEIRSEAAAPPREDPAEETRHAAAEDAAPPPRAQRRRGGSATWIIAALVLGAIAGGWLYRGVLSNYLPSDRMTALKNQVAALEQNNSDLAGQLAAVKQGADGAAQAAASASDAASQAAAAAKAAAEQAQALGTRLDQADQQIAAISDQITSTKADLDTLRKSLTSGASTGAAPASPADGAALAALGQRIDALEKDVASLKSAPGPSSQANATAALSQALSDLKAKVAAGTAYKDEYDRLARMVPAAAGLDVVAAHAADGIPSAQGLADQLTNLIPSLPAPEAPPAEDNSWFGTLTKSLSGIVTVRPIGETDWRAVAEKAAGLAAEGDLTQAIAVIDRGEGDKPIPLSQWRDLATARLALEAATSQVSEAVLRQITAQGGVAP